jgi:tetratricopeptide (TPR) repeat protein
MNFKELPDGDFENSATPPDDDSAPRESGLPNHEDDPPLGEFSSPMEEEERWEDFQLFCKSIHDATLAFLDRPVTPDDVKRFATEEAPSIILPEELEKKLAAWPDQLPGIRKSEIEFHSRTRPRGNLSSSVDVKFRAAPFEEVECLGRDTQITRACSYLKRPGRRTLVLRGSPGVGKTTLAKAIAKNMANTGVDTALSPSNIYFFDCFEFSTPAELTAALVSQLLAGQSVNAPVCYNERIALIKKRLFLGKKQPLLWIFDGLDAFVRDVRTKVSRTLLDSLARLLADCSEVTQHLKLIIPLSEVCNESVAEKIFDQGSVKVETVDLLPVGFQLKKPGGSASRLMKCPGSVGEHPLAALLLNAAAQSGRSPRPAQSYLFSSDVNSILDKAASAVWEELTEPEKTLLLYLAELPDGLWMSEDEESSHGMDIDWSDVFGDISWRTTLNKLRALEWIVDGRVPSSKIGRLCTYRLRPALRHYVLEFTPAPLRKEVCQRIVRLWASRLKQWSDIVSGRVRTRQFLYRRDGSSHPAPVVPEEYAHGLIDRNRQNWLYAFRRIAYGKRNDCGQNSIILYTVYLRGSISYCRITGLQTLFLAMADSAIHEIKRAVPRKTANCQWRRTANQIYLSSCYGMRGRTYRRLGNFDKARQNLYKAEEILRGLPESTRPIQRELGWVLTELGTVLHQLGCWSAAENKLKQAISIREALVHEAIRQEEKLSACELQQAFSGKHLSVATPMPVGDRPGQRRIQTERRFLASSLNIYGTVLTGRYNGRLAKKVQNDALDIRKELVGKLPLCFQRHLAKCYNDLGNAAFYDGSFYEAIIYYEEALKLRRRMAHLSENSLSQYVARTCNNIGNAYRKLGFWDKAESYLAEAVVIYRAAALDDSAAFNSLLARSLSTLGRVYYHQGRLRKAVEASEEADRLHALAYSAFCKTPPFDWIENCNYLAMAYLQSGLVNYAMFALKRVAPLLERGEMICERNTSMLRAYTWNTQAKVLIHSKNNGDWETAVSVLSKSEGLRLQLTARLDCPAVFQLEFAETWHNLGCALFKLNRHSEARGYLADALQLRRQLSTGNPVYISRLVARSALEMAEVELSEGRPAEALRLYAEAEDGFAKLRDEYPDCYFREFDRARSGRLALQNDSSVIASCGASNGKMT